MSDSPGLDPDLLNLPSLRDALVCRDITRAYQVLVREGIPQRRIAELVGQSQSEVSEIINGRQVMGYDVLVRICEGLGISRGMMGLAYDGVEEPDPAEGVTEEMRRRALLAAAGVALFGAPVLGELLHIPNRPPTPTPLPTQVSATDVTAIRNLTRELRQVARTYGGGADTMTEVAARSRVLMSISATDQVKTDLSSALAELHTLAGWTCVDSGLYDHARANFAVAMELAAGDPYQLASAFRHAGIQMVDVGAWNDGLKAFQLGMMGAEDPETVAWLHAETALPLAAMGSTDAALSAISKAREQSLTDPFDQADMDFTASLIYDRLGRVDAAERSAASSVRRWAEEGSAHRDSVEAQIMLASLHVRAGELDGPALASQAIDSVTSLRSTRARVKLRRLVDALETRPRPDFTELAHRARQVSAVQV